MSRTPDQWLREAVAHQQAGRAAEAAAAFEGLLALRPDLPDVWFDLGRLRRHLRRLDDALAAYSEAIRHGVRGAEEAHLNRAVILSDDLKRPTEAEVELRAALSLNDRYIPAWLNLGNLHEDRGERDAALAAYGRALEIEPDDVMALSRLASATRFTDAGDPVIGRIRARLATLSDATPQGRLDRADLGFALGRALDEAGDYEAAFAAYADANAASRMIPGPPGVRYDRAGHEALVERLIAAFPKAVAGDGGKDAPVFICGMFRSGSTLAEQILAAHSRVTAGGELELLPQLVRGALSPFPESLAALTPERAVALADAYRAGLREKLPNADVVTDKRPDNFLYVGLIKTLFPRARIIHTRRDPLDNCLSAWFLHLSHAMPWALDLEDAAHWYRQQERLMDHWKALWPDDIHTFDYDRLTREPEPVMRDLVGFCGLEWEDGCRSFHTVANAVRTASVWQVREPLFQRSSGRWRNYERHLGPLRAALEISA